MGVDPRACLRVVRAGEGGPCWAPAEPDRDHQVRPGGEGAGEGARDAVGGLGVDEVKHAAQHDARGRVQVEPGRADLVVGEDRLRVAHVADGRDDPGQVGSEEGLRVLHRDRIVVHVRHHGVGHDPAGGIVGGQPLRLGARRSHRGGGQAGADVEKLAHAVPGHVGDGAGLEPLVVQRLLADIGADPPYGLGRLAIGLEIVRAAEPVVVHARHVRLRCVKRRRAHYPAV